MSRRLVGVVALALAACGARARKVETGPTAAAAGALPEATGTPGDRLGAESPLVCPSANDAASRAYDEAYDAARAGNWDAAERGYLRALDLDPAYCDAMDNLAVIYRRQGRVDEAIALYERSVAVAPKNQVAWQNLGVAYRAKGRTEDALRAYERLIEIAPQNPEGWFGYGQILLIGSRFDEAIVALRRAEELYLAAGSPYVTDARYLLAWAFVGKEDWPTVRDLLEQIYPEVGGDPQVNLLLGTAYLKPVLRDAKKAREYLERARKLGAQVPDDLWQAAQQP